jgi:glutathione S-transferase
VKLYDCTMAPNPRRVRIFLAEKGVQIPRVEVDIIGGANLRPEYLAVNPRGLLPTLELDDGRRIDETIAICRYFEETVPEPALLGTTPLEKAEIESWQRHVEFDGFLAIGDIFRNTAPQFAKRRVAGRTGDAAIPDLVEQARVRVTAFWDALERRLSESEYIGGPRFSIADITALCAVDFAKWSKLSLPGTHAASLRWHAKVSARPSAQA